MKTGGSIAWHATVGLASAGLFMLVTKKGYDEGIKSTKTLSALALPAMGGALIGFARTRQDA
jgi:hypothetical protein